MRHIMAFWFVTTAASAQSYGVEFAPEGQIVRGSEILVALKDMVKHATAIAETEREKGDIIRLSAVNDALIQLNGLVNLADWALANLRRATVAHDDATRTHEFARLTIIYQKATVLVQQAENAVGEDLAIVVGETEVETVGLDPDETEDFLDAVQKGYPPTPEWNEGFAPRFLPDHDRFRFGIAGGILTTATKWRVDTYSPLVGVVGLPVSLRLTDRWRLVLQPGLTIDRSSQNGGDALGYSGLLETQWLSGGTVSPVVGLHSNAVSLDFTSGAYRIIEHGVHVGVAVPNNIVSVVFRLFGDREQTSEGAALTMGGMLELRAMGSSWLDRLVRAEKDAAHAKQP